MQKQPMGAAIAEDAITMKKRVDSYLVALAISLTRENLEVAEEAAQKYVDKHTEDPIIVSVGGKRGPMFGESEIARPEDRYSVCCVGCGIEMHLQMIPFRNEYNLLVGWVFSCETCRPMIINKRIHLELGEDDG